jgi:hypothetical protein
MKFFISINAGKKENLYLLFIFYLLAIAIFSKSYFEKDGFLSPDSTNYLSLAQNLIEGKGFSCYSSYSLNIFEKVHFSVWPVGYPVMIYIVSKLTGISVFWASKILNLFFIGVILIIFKNLFNRTAHVYGLILLFCSFITIFTFTWSETAFMCGLVWFSASLYKFANNTLKLFLPASSILLSSLFLFLSRYIGLFSILPICFLAIYLLLFYKDKLKFFILILISFINLFVISGYLYFNYVKTGFITGSQRTPAPETSFSLIKTLFHSFFNELMIISSDKNFILLNIFFYSFFAFITFKKRKVIFNNISIKKSSVISLPFIFVLVGATYLVFLIIMRWRTQFDNFSLRLVAPGFLLIFIAFINLLERFTLIKYFEYIKILMLITSMVSFIVNVPISIDINYSMSYHQNIINIKKRFNKIERNSIVMFPNIHLRYLYTDLILMESLTPSIMIKNESTPEFLFRIHKNHKKNIYLETQNIPLQFKDLNKSIKIINEHEMNTLVKLK